MFDWLKQEKGDEPRLSARKTLRTIETERGTRFDVFAESAHYVLCHPPEKNRDVPKDALLDLEDLAARGYWLCHMPAALAFDGGFIVFEKRGSQE